jgi:hypothetical protein
MIWGKTVPLRPRRQSKVAIAATRTRRLIEALEPRRLLSKTIYVDANSPGPTRDGTSWTNAYTDLQQGIAVSASGDQIHIADGTYKPTTTTNTSISFAIRPGVSIYGSYAGYGAAAPDARDTSKTPTVLSGDIGVVGTNNDNSVNVVTASGSGIGASTVLDGVTIASAFGAGIKVTSSASPTISNCTFTANVANNDLGNGAGGAIVCSSGSSQISSCAF